MEPACMTTPASSHVTPLVQSQSFTDPCAEAYTQQVEPGDGGPCESSGGGGGRAAGGAKHKQRYTSVK